MMRGSMGTRLKAAAMFAAAAGLASAAQALPPISLEKAEMSMMSVPKQKEVLARAAGNDSVNTVITLMLGDQLTDDFAGGTVVAVDFDDAVFVVRNKKGQLRVYDFDPFAMTLKLPSKPGTAKPAKP